MANPIIRYESAQTAHPFEAATDGGDATTFAASFAPFSGVSGAEPVIAPAGLLTGGAVVSAGTNDAVTVAALTAVMPWVAGADASGVIAVASGNLSAVRGSIDAYSITSLTITAAGALAAVAGTEGAAFSETRGAAGGPPYIDDDAIEIGQVRLSSTVAAAVAASEIFTVVGQHRERADYPVYQVSYATGEITFADSLPLIHTDGVTDDLPKLVYMKGSTPLFAPIAQTSDWVPAESTYSITSTDTYDGPVGSASSSLGQAAFTAVLKDGITDAVVGLKGQNLWFEFRPDRDKLLPKQLTQGIFGVSRTFPAGGGNFSASCTVTPRDATVDVAE